MKKVLIVLAILALLVTGNALAERYYHVLLMTGRDGDGDSVVTLPVATDKYYMWCVNDSVNFRFFNSDSAYVSQITLPGIAVTGNEHNNLDGHGVKAKYIHINAPDSTNYVWLYIKY